MQQTRRVRVVGRILPLASLGLLISSPAMAIDPNLFTINGYSSFEIEKQWEDEGNGDPNLSFDADLFDLVFNFLPTEKVRAAADFTWEHGAASEDGRGNVALEYGLVEYTLSDGARLRAGKMFVPFGLFNEIHTAKPAFLSVKEAASTNKPERIVDSERFFPRWAVGVGARGDLFVGGAHIDYSALISNGEQEETNPYEEDNNVAKALAGRVRLEAGLVRVGTSLYLDYLSEDGGFYQYSQGGQLELFLGNFELKAEGVVGSRFFDDGSSTTQFGWFIQPALRLDNGVTPYVRFDVIDPDLSIDADEGLLVLGGVNWEISRGLQLKLEHDQFRGASNSSLSSLPGARYNETKFALVLGF